MPGPRVGFSWTRETIIYALELWHRRYLCTPTKREWRRAGHDHPCVWTVREIFGSWNNAIKAAGFRARRPGERRQRHSTYVPPVQAGSRRWPADRIIGAIHAWVELHGEPPKLEDWRQATATTPTAVTVRHRFGTWNQAIVAAGYDARPALNPACVAHQNRVTDVAIRTTERKVTSTSPLKGEALVAIQLGDEAPDFTAETTDGTLALHDYLGDSWGVLFSHPADFTPVCTTELGRVAALKDEFDRRNTKVVGLSVDELESHERWAPDIRDVTGSQLNFPLAADPDRKVAELYGMIHPNASETTTVRSVFVIGPDKKVKLTLTYPASTGRDFGEILRVIDSLQLTAKHKVATPADWRQGEDVIITGAVSDEEAATRFPGYETVKPYLRTTAQPAD